METIRNNREKSNLIKFICAGALSVTGISLCSEGYIQAILLEFDHGAKLVGVYGVIAQIASAVGYVLFLFDGPYKKGFKTRFIVFAFLQVLFPLMLCGLFSASSMATVLLISGFSYHLAVAYRASCEQVAVPLLFERHKYDGAYVKINIAGTILSMVISLLLGGSRGVVMGSAAIGFLVSAIMIISFRMCVAGDTGTRIGLKGIVSCFSIKDFLPHFMRGLGMAGIYYFSVYGMERVNLNDGQKSALIYLSIAGMLVGYRIYDWMKRMNNGKITCIAFAGSALCMVMCPFLTVPITFLGGYFFVAVCNSLSSMAVTMGVFKSTSTEKLPFVTSTRMLLMNITRAVGTSLFAFLYASLWQESVIVLSVVVLLLTAVLFRKAFSDEWNV